MVVVVSVILTLVVDDPFLSNGTIWLIGVDVFIINKFVTEDIHGISSESVLEFLGSDVIMESLVMKTSPVVDNHVFVESFEKSTSWKTERF